MLRDERELLAATLARGTEEIGVPLSDAQLEMCVRYVSLLLQFNSHTNLTRITEPAGVAIKHFVDSLTVLLACPDLPEGSRIADVGTGAGFPGLVLKIARPDLKLALIDSLAKRLTFLRSVIETLELKDVTLFHLRAEDAGRDRAHRDVYDVVTARAVAALPTLLEWCCPLVRVGGVFVAMKSASVEAEMISGRNAARSLGCRLTRDLHVALPQLEIDAGEVAGRRLLVYSKQQPTPEFYPRNAATIKTRPLS